MNRTYLLKIAIVTLLAISFSSSSVFGQTPKKYGDLAEGPYGRLVIREAMVIPGHGGPPVGPYDIVIEGNTISEMIGRYYAEWGYGRWSVVEKISREVIGTAGISRYPEQVLDYYQRSLAWFDRFLN